MSFDQPTVLTQRTCHLFVRGVPPFNVPPSCEHSNPLSLHNAHVICSCAAYPLLTCLRPMSKQTHCPYIAHVSFVRAQAYPLLTCLRPVSTPTHCPYTTHVSFVRAQAYPLLTCLHPASDPTLQTVSSDTVILTTSTMWAQAPSVTTLALPAVRMF